MKVIDVPLLAGLGWIRQAFALFRGQPVGWISLVSCWFLLSMAVMLLVPLIGPMIALTLLQPALFAGLILAAVDQQKGLPVTPRYLFAGFRANGRALLTIGSITLLIEMGVVGILSMLGFPGTIPLEESGMPNMKAFAEQFQGKEWLILLGFLMMMSIKGFLWFTSALLATQKMPPTHAMRWSFYAVVANFLPIVLFGAMMFVLFFLAAIPWLLGFMVWIPVYALSHYVSFRQVFSDD